MSGSAPRLALLLVVVGITSCRSGGPRQVSPIHRDEAPGACNELAVIRFSEHLCSRLAADTKRITLRSRHRRQIRPGQWVQLVCMESRTRFLARVTDVRHATWRTITEQELRDDGFSAQRRMLEIMRRYYPGIRWDDPATVYRWDRSRRCP